MRLRDTLVLALSILCDTYNARSDSCVVAYSTVVVRCVCALSAQPINAGGDARE